MISREQTFGEPVDGILDVTTFDQLDEAGIQKLAQFNSEVARGIVHTDEYRARMAKLQERFDNWSPTIGHTTGRSPADWRSMSLSARLIEFLSGGRIGTRSR